MEDDLLLGREGIQFAAHALDALVDVPRVAVGGAFEEDMFDEVGQPEVARIDLVTGAAIDHDAAVTYMLVVVPMYDAQTRRKGCRIVF